VHLDTLFQKIIPFYAKNVLLQWSFSDGSAMPVLETKAHQVKKILNFSDVALVKGKMLAELCWVFILLYT